MRQIDHEALPQLDEATHLKFMLDLTLWQAQVGPDSQGCIKGVFVNLADKGDLPAVTDPARPYTEITRLEQADYAPGPVYRITQVTPRPSWRRDLRETAQYDFSKGRVRRFQPVHGYKGVVDKPLDVDKQAREDLVDRFITQGDYILRTSRVPRWRKQLQRVAKAGKFVVDKQLTQAGYSQMRVLGLDSTQVRDENREG